MPVIAPDPALPYGLAAVGPAVPPGAVQFNRKSWDNPLRYRLNRPFGDEFEYDSFQQLTRKWKSRLTSASDFSFPGASEVEWSPPVVSAAIWTPAPAGDFEALLEVGFGAFPGGIGPAMGLVDGAGTGIVGGLYLGTTLYTWASTTWANGTTGGNVASGAAADGRHQWLAIRRTGTLLQARWSVNGTSFTALTAGQTVSATAPFIAIFVPTTDGIAAMQLRLYRLNVYPGPTFFPG